MNETDIINLLRRDNEFMEVARGIDSQVPPDCSWCIFSGFVHNKVWDYIHGDMHFFWQIGSCGDSPEAKREQGEAYAKAHNIIIIETIKSIDRFRAVGAIIIRRWNDSWRC